MTEYTASEAAAKVSECLSGRAITVDLIRQIGSKYRLGHRRWWRRYYSECEVHAMCEHLKSIDRRGLFEGKEL